MWMIALTCAGSTLSPGLYYWPSDVYGDVLGRGTWGQVTKQKGKLWDLHFGLSCWFYFTWRSCLWCLGNKLEPWSSVKRMSLLRSADK